MKKTSTALSVPRGVVAQTTGTASEWLRDRAERWRSDTVGVTLVELNSELLEELSAAAETVGDKSFSRVLDSVLASRSGSFRPIPSFGAAPVMIVEFLRHEMIDGWVYKTEPDGYLHPYLVVDVEVEESTGRNAAPPHLRLRLRADDPSRGSNERSTPDVFVTFEPSDLTRKLPADALLAAGLHKETAALRADYDEQITRFQAILAEGFADQFRYTGQPLRGDDWRMPVRRENRKVIHDTHPHEVVSPRETSPTVLLAEEDDVTAVPVLTKLRVFDLHTHDFITVNAQDMTAYEYDQGLRDKLILPDDQRELLDILTTDISSFTGDIIEGKSSGNVILAKGKPGIGKTLTAEVYSEVIERPLYSIHSGSLGITAPDVRQNLEKIFTRAKRWDAVLLLDEADVFVLERGNDLQQNAIVAEFLRTLEYFDGLLFMTTNRADDIDDAILSRCAAIIDYQVPGAADARKVWEVLAAGHGITLAPDMLDALVDGYSHITPRDIKMLLRLALRVAASRGVELDVAIFAQCGMFRGLHFQPSTGAEVDA